MVDIGDTEESDFDGLDETDGIAVSLTELLEQVIVGAWQAGTGPVIGKVDTYDPVAGRASVTPLVPLLVDGEVVASPKLPSVPVSWPGSASHSIRWPIGAGSFVSLEPLGHDHGEWMTSGSPNIPPTSERRFSLADLVAKPLAPSPTANPPDPLSYDAAWGVLFGKWVVGDNTGTFVALANKVLTELQAIKTWADAHVHNAGPAGILDSLGLPCTGATLVPLAGMTAPGSVACEDLKAK